MKGNNANKIIVLIFLLTGLCRCAVKDVRPDPAYLGYAYFPLDSGLFRIYLVKEKNYHIDGQVDSSAWFGKEEQQSWFLNQLGDSVLLTERFFSQDSTGPWQLDSLIRVQKNKLWVLVTESNIPYVKLVFPVTESKSWNGNAYNSMGEEDYHYKNVSEKTTILNSVFPYSVTVIEKDLEDPVVNTVKNYEIYASGVGLVYRESIDYHYCTDPGCLGKGIILYGKEYRQWIINYGHE